MSTPRERLERLLGGPDLAALRERLRHRYEMGRTNDEITLTTLSADERRALEGLLGRRPRQAESMQLSIAELSQVLARSGLAASLRDALEQLDGPIQDIAAKRADEAVRWEAAFAACKCSPLVALTTQTAGRGLVKRLCSADPDRGRSLLDAASRVINALPASGLPLSRVAAHVLGDSHALDEGRPLATLVVAALRGAGFDERAREVWAKWGVLVSELSSPVLSLNLFARSDSVGGRLVNQARECGEPLHLSLRTLMRAPPRWDVAKQKVFACENPAVITMAADALGTQCLPLVCTDGMPAAAQQVLLRQLAAAGATLLYHGDFDWPGITIGNFVMRTFGAVPWRFNADDYELCAGRALVGGPITAHWDDALAPKMAKHGYALEEEAVVQTLFSDLVSG